MEFVVLAVLVWVAWALWGAAAMSGTQAEDERPLDEREEG